ncbi:cob(I)yrinic acid a,c-diamide adenosyltransferase [Enterovirga rhinocerotis]|uniref:Corrinoid adenosyltransferase n=1 Tax=Enterovirga rhinocerotis TaxID=1339210 RepID=A0A4R7BUW3_9HYPH|nr:cob(I)yrinic acid a,c-diamide adenosyltransferase [Enterovirga rhinocerotis]TDR89590.1 ATP:cob(I)alamin adenosyltransferase [Enterovirga rhinocerotis]
MVALNRIYTKAGDGGGTQLVGGERRRKSDLRIECYGTVDELNATLGLVRLHTSSDPDADALLARIQNDLFDLGADLATPPRDEPRKREDLRILDSQVDRLEGEIDAMNADLAPLRSFVLPGGTPVSAHLHLARTVCRRAERLAVALAEKPEEKVAPEVIRYLNRLSDLLFVAARFHNDRGARDVLWVPGQNR